MSNNPLLHLYFTMVFSGARIGTIAGSATANSCSSGASTNVAPGLTNCPEVPSLTGFAHSNVAVTDMIAKACNRTSPAATILRLAPLPPPN